MLELDANTSPASGVTDHLREKKISIVAGGLLSDDLRRQVEEGGRPRLDVFELERWPGARLLDFGAFAGPGPSGVSGMLKPLEWFVGKRSQSLAYHILDAVKDDDLVYATGEDVGYALGLLMRMFGLNKPALVVRLDQATLGRSLLRRMISDVYIGAAIRRMDRIGCHSAVQAQYLSNIRGVPFGHLCLLRPKVDHTFYDPAFKDESGADVVPEGAFILSAGLEERDYKTLILAASDLPVQVVIGAASPWSRFRFGEHAELPPNVIVSAFNPRQMRQLYRAAACVVVPVHPTLRTCGITVMLESWSMKKAVVATRTIGLTEYGRDGEDVLFFQPYDASDLRDRITRLLDDPSLANSLGEAGRLRVESELNLDHNLAEMEQVFAEALISRAG